MKACAKIARDVLIGALLGILTGLHPARAAHAQVGTLVPDRDMARLDGGKARLLADAGVSALVFFRPNQEHSRETLKEMADCQKRIEGTSVRWVAIVSSTAPAAAAMALVRETGINAPALVDADDALYASLGVVLHPVVVIIGRDGRLAAFEPFRSVNLCSIVAARIRRASGEISEEDLRRVLEPPKAVNGGDIPAARRNLRLAEALFRSGNHDKALEHVRTSIERDPTLAAAHALMGDIIAARGNCSEAVKAYQKAIEIDPASGAARAGIERCAQAR